MNTLRLGCTYKTLDGQGTGRVVADDIGGDGAHYLVVLEHPALAGGKSFARYISSGHGSYSESYSLDVNSTSKDISHAPAPIPDDMHAKLSEQGFTENEIYSFWSTVNCANAVLALPDIHPMDREEFCSAFHIIQDKILARVAVKAIRGIVDK